MAPQHLRTRRRLVLRGSLGTQRQAKSMKTVVWISSRRYYIGPHWRCRSNSLTLTRQTTLPFRVSTALRSFREAIQNALMPMVRLLLGLPSAP